jgi:methyltransferase (TIGR00027 family)
MTSSRPACDSSHATMTPGDRRSGRLVAGTAEATAALRAAGAAEPDPAVRGPDHLAGRFISPGLKLAMLAKFPGTRRLVPRFTERILPGAYFYELARTRLMDEVLVAELDRGLSQFVVLGAGFDTRAYRFAARLRETGVSVFEVDHPATSRLKRRRLERLFGGVPEHVSLVEVDFDREDLAALLAASGYNTGRPTLFNWSGVAVYLTADAVDAVLSYVAAHESPRTSIVFDYAYSEMLDGSREYFGAAELKERTSRLGEPLRFGIPEGKIDTFLGARGLELVRHVRRDELGDLYLIGSDGRLRGRPYEFGGIAHARVAKGTR